MQKKCDQCIKAYLQKLEVCPGCGNRLRPSLPAADQDRRADVPAGSRTGDPEPPGSAGVTDIVAGTLESRQLPPAGKPSGINLGRDMVGTSKRKVTIRGAKDVDLSTRRVARDEDDIEIDAGEPGNPCYGYPLPGDACDGSAGSPYDDETIPDPDVADIASACAATVNYNLDLHKDRVARDESTTNVNIRHHQHIVVNNYIVPGFQREVRLWDQQRGIDSAGRTIRNIFVATRKSIMEFRPEERDGALTFTGNYEFKQPVEKIRSLTPLDVAGEAVLLVGFQRDIGVWQPLEANRSELGYYRCRTRGEVSGGFNSVTVFGDYIYGSHSELGLVRWSMSEPDRPRRMDIGVTSPAAGAVPAVSRDCLRSVKAMKDSTMFLVRNDSVVALVNEEAPHIVTQYACPELAIRRCLSMDRQSKYFGVCRSPFCLGKRISVLSDLAVVAGSVFGLSENGVLVRWDRDKPRSGSVVRNFGAPGFSIRTMKLFGLDYLVIGCGFGVHLIPVEPGHAEYFYSYPSGSVNHAFAASDFVIAQADDLQTLVVWKTTDPGAEPVQLIHLKDQYNHLGQCMSVLVQ